MVGGEVPTELGSFALKIFLLLSEWSELTLGGWIGAAIV